MGRESFETFPSLCHQNPATVAKNGHETYDQGCVCACVYVTVYVLSVYVCVCVCVCVCIISGKERV